VLLEGESGTGKELLARRLHALSLRNSGPFVPVSCPSISESLFESQFYGHVKGAFTGAMNNTLGIVRAAEGGTLFLDEVGELPLHLQPKLLRLLQEREVVPVGAAVPIPVNARFIAATNRNLLRAVSGGGFRHDLYHRLNVVRIEIPPLRSRPSDIDALLDFYLEHYACQYNVPVRTLSDSLRNSLRDYSWPGNVRELCCYVERIYATNQAALPPAQPMWNDNYRYDAEPQGVHVEPQPQNASVRVPAQPAFANAAAPRTGGSIPSLAQAEAHAIQRALELTNYNRSAAAKLLDIHRSTLIRKMRILGIND
jgi:transcriptional regulator with PAS, ATPase and Fis domain